MEIIRSSNPAKEAGRRLSDILEENEHRPILLMLSGGSAFAVLDDVDTQTLGSKITVSVLDERYSTDPSVNNFLQLTRTDFYIRCLKKGVNFISTEVQVGESLESVADKWRNNLKKWKENNPDGIIIATMGIGNDGHTAGIFGGKFGVDFDSNEWVIAYAVPKEINEYTDRITVTKTFLKTQVDLAIVYAVGDKKRIIIDGLSNSDRNIENLPACILKEMKRISVFTNI